MKTNKFLVAGAAAALLLVSLGNTSRAGDKPTITKPCVNCHKAKDDVVRGKLTNLSNKAGTLQINVGKNPWLFRFDEGTALKNVEAIKKLKKDKETAVTFAEKDGKLYAVQIAAKPVFKVPADQLVDTGYMLKLIEKSPAEGNYVIVDARPGPKYHEGHIKNAVSMPLPAFDKMKDKVLPAEKDKVIVFYCGGVT